MRCAEIKIDNIFVQIQDESLIAELYLSNNPTDPAGFDPIDSSLYHPIPTS